MSVLSEYDVVVGISSIVYLVAVYYSFRLSQETKHEKYWLMLATGFFIFAIHHWMMMPASLGFISNNLRFTIEQFSSIVGALLVAYSTRGLFTSMKRVREKVE